MGNVRIRPVCNKNFVGFVGTGQKYEASRRQKHYIRSHQNKVPNVSLPETPSDSHPLYGPILKLREANDKIDQLDREIKSLGDPEFNSVCFEDEPETEFKQVRLLVRKMPDPKWNVRIGEIAHNLRSALEVAVTQISLGLPDCPSKFAFPIFLLGKSDRRKTRSDGQQGALVQQFDREGRKQIKHLPKAYQVIIEEAQPYHAGSYRRHHPLWLLQELNNADKHNEIAYTATAIAGSNYQFLSRSSGFYTDTIELCLNVRFEDGAYLARVRREVQVRPDYSGVVRFGDRCRAVAGKEVIATLRSIEEEVRKIISAFGSRLDH